MLLPCGGTLLQDCVSQVIMTTAMSLNTPTAHSASQLFLC